MNIEQLTLRNLRDASRALHGSRITMNPDDMKKLFPPLESFQYIKADIAPNFIGKDSEIQWFIDENLERGQIRIS